MILNFVSICQIYITKSLSLSSSEHYFGNFDYFVDNYDFFQEFKTNFPAGKILERMKHYWWPLYKRFSTIYWLFLVKNGFPTENGSFLMEVIQRIGTIWWFSHLSQFRQISSELWKTQPKTILWNTSDHLITLFKFFFMTRGLSSQVRCFHKYNLLLWQSLLSHDLFQI